MQHKANVVLQINSALNVLRAVEPVAAELPKRLQRKLPVASVQDAIYRLELAKAELTGEPLPQPPAPTQDIIDAAQYIEW